MDEVNEAAMRKFLKKLSRLEAKLTTRGWENCPRCSEMEHPDYLEPVPGYAEGVCPDCLAEIELSRESEEEAAWLRSKGLY